MSNNITKKQHEFTVVLDWGTEALVRLERMDSFIGRVSEIAVTVMYSDSTRWSKECQVELCMHIDADNFRLDDLRVLLKNVYPTWLKYIARPYTFRNKFTFKQNGVKYYLDTNAAYYTCNEYGVNIIRHKVYRFGSF